MRWCVSEPEKGLILPIHSSQLLGDGGKTEIWPFFQLILIIFGLILQNLVSQGVWVNVIDELSYALNEFVEGKINKSLLTGDSSGILLKVLFGVLDFENHDGQKLCI